AHTYDDIKTIADHRHYLGATPHAGNNKSDAAGGGHAHAGLCITQHPSWPEGIRGNVLMNNIHGARINMDVLERKGSGYVAHHGANFIAFHDKASQIVDLREGPDGTLFMIDWYDLNQCHNPRREAHDYTTGRIFRLGRKGQIVKAVDLAKMGNPDLMIRSMTGDEREARSARLKLQERSIPDVQGHALLHGVKVNPQLRDLLTAVEINGSVFLNNVKPRLRDLLTGHSLSLLREWVFSNKEAEEQPPEWLSLMIQFGAEIDQVRDGWAQALASNAGAKLSPIVRLALASACQRLTVEQRKPIVLALLAHEEDKDDHNLPLMYWYAAEPIVAADPAWAAEALTACKIPKVAEFIARRMSEK
ncbi:MAG: dehydrogenase, partial [Chthoniobacteraceae bacterium]